MLSGGMMRPCALAVEASKNIAHAETKTVNIFPKLLFIIKDFSL
jgi:hypothetical protein